MLHVFKPHAPNQVQLRVMESMQQGSLMKLKQQQQQQQHGAQTKRHGPQWEKSALQQHHPSTKSAGVHETSGSSKRSQQPASQAHGKLMSTPSPEASPRLDISAPGSPSWKAHSPSPLANATGANAVSHHQRHAPSPATLPSKPSMAPYTAAAAGTALPASLRAPAPHKARPQPSQWVGSSQPCTRTVTVYSSKGVVQRTTSTAPATAPLASPSPPGDEGRRRGVKRERDGAAMPPPTSYHHHHHHHKQHPQHFHAPSALCPCFMCFYHLAATMMRAMPHLQPPSQHHHHASAPKRQPPYPPPQAPKAPWRRAAATTATASPAPTTAAAATAAAATSTTTKASATASPPPRHHPSHHMATAATSAMYADATAAPQPRPRQRKRQRSAGPIVQPVLVNAATPHSAPLIGSYDCEGDVYTVTIRLDGSIVPPEEVATQPIVVEAD